MTMFGIAAIGMMAGLHGASYGAYKDSPHEAFIPRRFARELLFAGAIAVGLSLWHPRVLEQSAFIVFLSIFALTRTVTEFWKLFIRVEPQDGYRIPTQMHYVTGVIHNPFLRLMLGIGFLASIYGIYHLGRLWPVAWPPPVRGLLTGLSIGVAEAMAGGYKDGAIEGFSWRKFFKSPVFGAIGGVIASGHTSDPAFLLLASIGSMRMFLELLFKMVVPSYVPGKFRSMTGPFSEWMVRRQYFLMPYALTWLLYVALCSHLDW
jgi:hypothetical protein